MDMLPVSSRKWMFCDSCMSLESVCFGVLPSYNPFVFLLSLLSSLFLQLLVGKCIVVLPHFRLSVVAKSPSYVLEIPLKMILRVKSV